ncbi:MAG: alpha/beta hydrolase [Clostridia bacterium]|nr:alpha/beta hydrolase [Clostridia bacterium]
MKEKPVFKSEQGRDRILTRYRSLIERLPVPYRERAVPTSFGGTYVLEAGGEELPPVLLLHGSCSNSAMWIGDIGPLSAAHRVLCVDIVGEAGNSAPNRPALSGDGYARWLGEVLDGLGIPKTDLIGNSLGGWIALQFAALYPDRIAHMVLIAPSGIVPTRPSYLLRLLFHAAQGKKGMAALARLMYGSDDVPEEVVEVSTMIMDNYNPIVGALPVLSDERMGRLAMPVLYIVGADDVTADTGKAAERLRRLVPKAQIERIPNHGHVVFDTMDRVVPFLAEKG